VTPSDLNSAISATKHVVICTAYLHASWELFCSCPAKSVLRKLDRGVFYVQCRVMLASGDVLIDIGARYMFDKSVGTCICANIKYTGNAMPSSTSNNNSPSKSVPFWSARQGSTLAYQSLLSLQHPDTGKAGDISQHTATSTMPPL
jgi:hypothetical protein